MSIVIIQLEDIARQAWRNGGGVTRELLTWPSVASWSLRISCADIEKDGPFSPYPGVDRWFVVLRGAGVNLTFADRRRTLRLGQEPMNFDGAESPGCKLIDGPTLDLNLMSRGGSSIMQCVDSQNGWQTSFQVRGLYTSVAGCWYGLGLRRNLEPHSLLWARTEDERPWRFVPEVQGKTPAAWWLGHSPERIAS